MDRCPWAIKWGTTFHTRCSYGAGHKGNHLGRGLAEYSYQRIEWTPGDSREYQTERTELHAWEER